jgi:hypothetical protein
MIKVESFKFNINLELINYLKDVATSTQLAHVVASDRVGPTKSESIIAWEVTNTAAVMAVKDKNGWWRFPRPLLHLFQLDEFRQSQLVPIEEWEVASYTKPLIQLQNTYNKNKTLANT